LDTDPQLVPDPQLLTLPYVNSSRTKCYETIINWAVMFKKLPGRRLVKKFPAFYGTRRFITSFKALDTCSFEPDQSAPWPPTSWRFIL